MSKCPRLSSRATLSSFPQTQPLLLLYVSTLFPFFPLNNFLHLKAFIQSGNVVLLTEYLAGMNKDLAGFDAHYPIDQAWLCTPVIPWEVEVGASEVPSPLTIRSRASRDIVPREAEVGGRCVVHLDHCDKNVIGWVTVDISHCSKALMFSEHMLTTILRDAL